MSLEERRKRILEELEKNGRVRVTEISRLLDCSEVTIRNDIQAMHEAGLLQRVHGGAIRQGAASSDEPSLPNDPTLHRHEAEKRKIAAYAYKQIKAQDMILIAAPQMEVKKAILKTTDKVYVLADSSKFEGGYLFVVGPMDSAYQYITDSKVKPEYLERARRENIPLVVFD